MGAAEKYWREVEELVGEALLERDIAQTLDAAPGLPAGTLGHPALTEAGFRFLVVRKDNPLRRLIKPREVEGPLVGHWLACPYADIARASYEGPRNFLARIFAKDPPHLRVALRPGAAFSAFSVDEEGKALPSPEPAGSELRLVLLGDPEAFVAAFRKRAGLVDVAS